MKKFLLDSDIRQIADGLPVAVVSALAGKRLLLTGGRGFLGRYFTAVFKELNTARLQESPVRVTVCDTLIASGAAGDVDEADDNFSFTTTLPEEPHDLVLYCAGIASPAHYRKFPLHTIDAAVTDWRRVLEAATPKTRLVFFSSSEIYGDPDSSHVPTAETYRGNVSCLGPRACYDESKRLGETLARVYSEVRGTQACIVRPFNVFGPGMQKTDYRVLPNFAARVAAGEPLQLYGNGNQTRTYCYVTDAIDGFLRALVLGRPGEPYNIGNPTPEISVHALADLAGTAIGRPLERVVMDHPASYPADEPSRRCPDISKAQFELGYAPRVELADGLRRFFGWAAETY